ncbi:MAG: c-type cytochrome [Pseudomonadota bacterium]|nr:c-type cytochrome [Pseudomonadota bacterium]
MNMRLTAVVLLLAMSGAAGAQDRERLAQRSVAAACAQCHGTDGVPAPGSSLPPLAGMPRGELVAQLKAFKAGTRPGTIMPQLSKGYSDAQIDLLASYFAAAGK